MLTLSCPDRPGIVAAVAGLLADHGGNITESQQFGDADSGLFFMRVQVTAAASRQTLEGALTALAQRFDLTWELDVAGRPVRTLVMVSTAAHCLNDLAFRQRSEGLPIDIVAVVSNHEVLRPLADFYDIGFHHLPVSPDTKAAAEARLLELVEHPDGARGGVERDKQRRKHPPRPPPAPARRPPRRRAHEEGLLSGRRWCAGRRAARGARRASGPHGPAPGARRPGRGAPCRRPCGCGRPARRPAR